MFFNSLSLSVCLSFPFLSIVIFHCSKLCCRSHILEHYHQYTDGRSFFIDCRFPYFYFALFRSHPFFLRLSSFFSCCHNNDVVLMLFVVVVLSNLLCLILGMTTKYCVLEMRESPLYFLKHKHYTSNFDSLTGNTISIYISYGYIALY